MTLTISRKNYVDLFGPTTGDRIRLADAWELFCSLTLEEQNKLTNLQYEQNATLR